MSRGAGKASVRARARGVAGVGVGALFSWAIVAMSGLASNAALAADPEAAYGARLKASIAANGDPDVLVQHAINRFTYGAKPDDFQRYHKATDAQTQGAIYQLVRNQLFGVRRSSPLLDGGFVGAQLAQFPTECVNDESYDAAVDKRCYRLERPIAEMGELSQSIVDAMAYYRDVCDGRYPDKEDPRRASDPDCKEFLRYQGLSNSIRSDFVLNPLTYRKLLLAVHSSYQFRELMTAFWYDHFNVDFNKVMVPTYLQEVAIRRNQMRSMSALTKATSQNAAMMRYLDNDTNRYTGNGLSLNENYGRELIELHTIGLDGSLYAQGLLVNGRSYSQDEVRLAARMLTGWSASIRSPASSPEAATYNPESGFYFSARYHDASSARAFTSPIFASPGVKASPYFERCTPHKPCPQGTSYADGAAFERYLVSTYSAANQIAEKLVRRFVFELQPGDVEIRVVSSGDPVKCKNSRCQLYRSIVSDLVSAYLNYADEGNQLEMMYWAMASHGAFWSSYARGAKARTPFELAAAVLRNLPTPAYGAGPGCDPSKGNCSLSYCDFLRWTASAQLPPADAPGTGCKKGPSLAANALAFVMSGNHAPYQYPFPTGYTAANAAWLPAAAIIRQQRFLIAASFLPVLGSTVMVPTGVTGQPSVRTVIESIGRRVLGSQPPQALVDAIYAESSVLWRNRAFFAIDPNPNDRQAAITGDAMRVILSLLIDSPQYFAK